MEMKIDKATHNFIVETIVNTVASYPIEELFDCVWIKRGKFGFPVDVKIDTGRAYEYLGLPPAMFFRNGYGEQNEFLPILIGPDPNRRHPEALNITQRDYYRMENFVARNWKKLMRIANEELDVFDDLLTKGFILEGKAVLNEMSKLRPSKTGLFRNIWVDEGETYKKGGHWLRIKVETDGSHSTSWATLKIPSYEWIGADAIPLPERRQIEGYVKANIETLSALMLGKIDLEDYNSSSLKVDGKGNAITKNVEVPEWIEVYDVNFGMKVYKHNKSPFGYIYSKDGKSSFFVDSKGKPIIFDDTRPFNSKGLAYASIGDKLYLLNANGGIKLL